MEFSNLSTYGGILQDIDFLLFGKSNITSDYATADKTRNVNRHFDDVVSLILQSDGNWKWDDTNNTDQNIGTINLVNAQQEYELIGSTYLTIDLIKVKDANGKYQVLQPVNHDLSTAQHLTHLEEGNAGMPRFYDKLGDYIYLYPKPSSSLTTLTDGLKVYFQRGASYFLSTDTTKVPGFAAPYHRILSVGAALDYALANGMNAKINILTPMLERLKQGLVDHYASRDGDMKPSMSLRRENYGSEDGLNSGYAVSDKRVF